jgi:hypothetical protein
VLPKIDKYHNVSVGGFSTDATVIFTARPPAVVRRAAGTRANIYGIRAEFKFRFG